MQEAQPDFPGRQGRKDDSEVVRWRLGLKKCWMAFLWRNKQHLFEIDALPLHFVDAFLTYPQLCRNELKVSKL